LNYNLLVSQPIETFKQMSPNAKHILETKWTY
jgi:hypothetical protein